MSSVNLKYRVDFPLTLCINLSLQMSLSTCILMCIFHPWYLLWSVGNFCSLYSVIYTGSFMKCRNYDFFTGVECI